LPTTLSVGAPFIVDMAMSWRFELAVACRPYFTAQNGARRANDRSGVPIGTSRSSSAPHRFRRPDRCNQPLCCEMRGRVFVKGIAPYYDLAWRYRILSIQPAQLVVRHGGVAPKRWFIT
jgi:hypothetical protein